MRSAKRGDEEMKKLKSYVVKHLTKETMNCKDWHDARYYHAIKAGVSHHSA